MTYVDTTQRDEYTATSLQTVFAYTFRILANTDLVVYNDGILQTLTTHYTVSGVGDAGGGNVTFVTGVTLNNTVINTRDTPDTQNTDYTPSGPFPSTATETAFDKLTMKGQDLDEKLSRALKFAITSLLNDIAAPEGTSATDRGGKVWAWNGAGTALELLAATIVDSISLIAVKGDMIQGGSSGDAEKLAVGATSAVYQVVAGKIASVTNPIFLLPTIANLINMTHDHSNAAGGGTLPPSSIVAPINYRSGLNCKQATSTTITVEGGVIDVDGTTIEKTSNTTLNLTTDAHWIGGSSLQATGTSGYIYIDGSGNILMHTTAPDESDTSANTTGILRYNDFAGGTDYRMISWFYMNATGSGELNSWEVGNLKDGDVHNAVTNPQTGITLNDTSFSGDLDATIIHFYSSGRSVLINGGIEVTTAGGANQINIQVNDGSGVATTIRGIGAITATHGLETHHLEVYPQGVTIFKIQGKTSANSHTVTGVISVTEQ